MSEQTVFTLCVVGYVVIGVLFTLGFDYFSNSYSDPYEAAGIGTMWPLFILFLVFAGLWMVIGRFSLWLLRRRWIKKTAAIIAALTLTITASADPPCRVVQRQQVVAGSIHAATIYADTHLHLVEVPVPAFVFQTLTAYQPTVQVQQNAVAVQPVAVDGVGTDDQLAALLGMAPSQANTTTPLAEIIQKCGSCHSAGAAKAGLTLMDATGQYNPSTTKNNTLTRSLIASRARSTGEDAMPPGANTNPAKRLSEDAIRFLEQ